MSFLLSALVPYNNKRSREVDEEQDEGKVSEINSHEWW